MTRHPHALEERRGRPAADTHHTAVTTAANRVRDWVSFSFSSGWGEKEGQGHSLHVDQGAQCFTSARLCHVHEVHDSKPDEQMKSGRLIQVVSRGVKFVLTERSEVTASYARVILDLLSLHCLAQGHFGRADLVSWKARTWIERAVSVFLPPWQLSMQFTSEHIYLCSCALVFI